MATTPTIHKTLKITSERLCFGALHNIWSGACAPPITGLPNLPSRAFGTVKAHPLEFNLPALNGTWHAYRLLDTRDNQATAWLIAHSSVDPVAEIDRILRVSGAPGDVDSGSRFNNEDTRAAGILVVNRYDWGYYHTGYQDEIGEGVEEGQSDILANSNSLGIVDFEHAKDTVTLWQGQKPSEREWSESGAWLYIPLAEYMFGRFGYDEAKKAAQSFLFFCANTNFTKTVFEGMETTVRIYETPEELFARRLREGYDFSGLRMIHEMATPPEDPTIVWTYAPRTPIESCFGPYEKEDWLFDAENIEALRVHKAPLPPGAVRDGHVNGEFVEPWVEPVYELLNELALSYLEQKIVPRMANLDVAAAIEALFPPPRTGRESNADAFFYKHFENPDEEVIHGFDYDAVTGRIKSFLSKFEKEGVVYHDECIAGICRVIALIFAELLELAGRFGLDYAVNKIMPRDIRLGVYNNGYVFRVLQFSRVFWEGRVM